MLLKAFACISALATSSFARVPQPNTRPFTDALAIRDTSVNSLNLTVDLGYGLYQGYYNTSADLHVWKAIRYAAAPTGTLRWQAPQSPVVNRSTIVNATKDPTSCPNQPAASPGVDINSVKVSIGSEDCLFLNVFAPANANKLPVFVWIHGGGYGGGNAAGYDPTSLVTGSNNSFIAVVIQYRLGSFGFLASDEVYRKGVVNAGLLDQHFALEWVQAYISLFGGDPTHVTVAGESAGGGSVMLQAMAYSGTLGTSLFRNAFAASPYLPMQYKYSDWVPSQTYYAFAAAANCSSDRPYGYLQRNQTIFDCLVNATTETLQTAGYRISGSSADYEWAFLPVTDGVFVRERPTQQLLKRNLNGVNLLIGNNADEGVLFVPQNIKTEGDLTDYLQVLLPEMPDDRIQQILSLYPGSTAPDDPNAPLYFTTGSSGLTAVNQSGVGAGHQQRANDIYAETTFVCPALWMAEAYSGPGKQAYKYQYSVPGATHGTDLWAYGMRTPPQPSQGPDLVLAFQNLIGNFVTRDNPSLSSVLANGAASANTNAVNAASSWPAYSLTAPYMINLNESGGVPYTNDSFRTPVNLTLTAIQGPGLRNNFTLVNAYTWEGGRGIRCEFWRSIAALVPE